ncbi:MAG: sigma-70 family RNA polymerase sigma factor [Verrucomicrobiales bacterium]|nr:sigma-70 family RNA polymerase sigma factor [Verrucomicrobiales bacterium]
MADCYDSDATLMVQVREGDREAFEALVTKYRQPVLNFVARTLRDEAEAEDIAQQTFVQVWKSAARYEASARFTTWLFTIARNLCLNEIRRRSRHPADSLDTSDRPGDDQPAPQYADPKAPSAPDHLSSVELADKVEEAIRDLPETQRTALLLCREDELSYEQMAQILGITLSATKSIIFRGRETLKQRLKPYLRTGDWRVK